MAMAIYIPDDIMVQILSRLPVKSLLRFKSVSKSWFSRISCTDFAKMQFERASSVPEIGFCEIRELGWRYTIKSTDSGSFKSRSFELPFLNDRSSVGIILGSVNGLLCVCTSKYEGIHIWNPCTKHYKKLPALVYQVRTKVIQYGFGYDSTTDDYKLLIVTFSLRDLDMLGDADAVINLFSLKRGTWRSFVDSKFLNNKNNLLILEASSGIFLNDAIHWAYREILPNRIRSVIVAFGLAEETSSIIPSPSFSIFPSPKLCPDQLSVLDGCLCLCNIICNYFPYRITITIRMMKEYGLSSSWTELINAEAVSGYISKDKWTALCLKGEGEIVFKDPFRSLASFDIQKNSIKMYPKNYIPANYVSAVAHVETLMSPNAST